MQTNNTMALRCLVDEPLAATLDEDWLKIELTTRFKALLKALNLPGKIKLDIHGLPLNAAPMNVYVNDVRCRYSAALATQMHAAVTNTPPRDVMPLADIHRWLMQTDTPMLRERFLARLAVAALKSQPAAMVSHALSEQWHRYFVKEHAIPYTAEALHAALSRVVGLGIGLERLTDVLPTLTDIPDADLPEALVAALQPETTALHMHPGILHADDDAYTAQIHAAFERVRADLLAERGISTPELTLEPDLLLPERGFALRVNDLLGVPYVGVADDTCLANIAAADLRQHGIEAAPVLNLATYGTASRIAAADRVRVEALGVTVWDQLGYVMACVAAALREHGPSLMSNRSTEARLDALAAGGVGSLTVPRITEALRELARAGASVQDLRGILAIMQSLDTADDMPGLRQRTAEAIIAPHRAGGVLPVYVLERDLEELLTAERAHSEAVEDRILAAIGQAVGDGTPRVRLIITSERARPALTALVRPVFPQLTVIGRESLPPGTSLAAG